MRRRASLLALGAALPVLLTGCASSTLAGQEPAPATTAAPRLSVTGAYIPLPSTPDMAAGYFVLRNDGNQAATLTGVSSPEASSVSMHQSTATTMVDLPTVRIPAHSSVTFARGGRHLMLMGLDPAPKVGAHVVLRLHFDDAAPVTVLATVRPLTYQPGQ